MQHLAQILTIHAPLASTIALSLLSVFHNPNTSAETQHSPSANLTIGSNYCTVRYGRNPILVSCQNGRDKIKSSIATQSFCSKKKLKGTQPCVSLPIRYLSDDGTCAIDILMDSPARIDYASGLEISESANSILEEGEI